MLRNPHQALTILTSESFSRAGVVQILRSPTSKSAPTPPVFNDFGFQIALARWRCANFVDILGSRSSATPIFRTYLCEPSKPRIYGKTQDFAQFLPSKISHVSHLRCRTSLVSNIDAARPSGKFHYSRKLELLNFLRQPIPTRSGRRSVLQVNGISHRIMNFDQTTPQKKKKHTHTRSGCAAPRTENQCSESNVTSQDDIPVPVSNAEQKFFNLGKQQLDIWTIR